MLAILGARAVETVHNHHNFAWNAEHGGEAFLVVRKGATPAWPRQKGFVGGSIGDWAAVVAGVDTTEAESALHSTMHGAGADPGGGDSARGHGRGCGGTVGGNGGVCAAGDGGQDIAKSWPRLTAAAATASRKRRSRSTPEAAGQQDSQWQGDIAPVRSSG